MEIKKNPKANLENYSKLFLQLGLVLALLISYLSIEYKTFDRELDDLLGSNLAEEEEIDIPLTERIELVQPPPPPPPAPEKIEIVEDEKDVIETPPESTEADQDTKVEITQIVEADEEEEVMEDVPFSIIEDAPVYPGCKGSKAELKKCLQKSIQKHVGRKFNTELANELGLDPGKKKVYVVFKIDKKGNITNVRARAPHARLAKEGEKVVKMLPKMIPGKQRGRPVGVKYTLPITLQVE